MTNVGTNLYDVTLTKDFGSASGPSTFTITAGSSYDKIRNLVVRNREASQLLRVNVTPSPGTQIASVDSIEYGSGSDGSGHSDSAGMAFILSMRVAGNLGNLKVTRAFDSIIGGNVTGVIDMPAIAGYSA